MAVVPRPGVSSSRWVHVGCHGYFLVPSAHSSCFAGHLMRRRLLAASIRRRHRWLSFLPTYCAVSSESSGSGREASRVERVDFDGIDGRDEVRASSEQVICPGKKASPSFPDAWRRGDQMADGARAMDRRHGSRMRSQISIKAVQYAASASCVVGRPATEGCCPDITRHDRGGHVAREIRLDGSVWATLLDGRSVTQDAYTQYAPSRLPPGVRRTPVPGTGNPAYCSIRIHTQ